MLRGRTRALPRTSLTVTNRPSAAMSAADRSTSSQLSRTRSWSSAIAA